ncbi:alpha/beta hydrolase [Pseudonocardia sp. CA-107938]|uniref:alpha/beta hydrolase n=1 Tax=Pseudonocardia sp. CA-107938 TaxID=3240021 RepID=UPI003D92CF90
MTRASTRRAVAALCAATGAVAVAACGAAAPPTSPAPVPPGLERFYAQQLAWGPCDSFAPTPEDAPLYADGSLQCARLEVPLDYAAPGGRTAQIAVLRHRTDDPRRIGSLVLNPGGPGGSGTQAAAAMSRGLGDGPFDVVGFDPRGIGASTPKLGCRTREEERADRAETDRSAEGVEAAEQEVRDFVAKCVQRSGGVDVLANSGTRDVARDLDVLRAALGDRKLTYLGYSYGTFLGSTYAELFPGNVRAMILDGAVDPAQDSDAEAVDQQAGFQHAFEVYAADCAKAATCPLGTDPAAATAAFQALSRPLLHAPVPAGDGRTLSYGDTITAVIASLYAPSRWPALTAGLAELRTGSGARLLAIADQYYELPTDVLTIVRCADDDRDTDRAAAADLAARARAAAPFADPGTPVVGALGPCELWPAPPTSNRHVPHAAGLPTVLVVSTTGDPATPYTAGVALADALQARLLTVEGTQHGAVFEGWSCVDSVAVAYLVDLTLPAPGTRCSTTQEVTK